MDQAGTKRSVPWIVVQVVATLVAIVVIVIFVAGFVHGDGKNKMFKESRVDTTKIKLKKYAFEAYPSWLAAHPDKPCPDKLADLNEYMNNEDSNDSWGKSIKMLCGANLPAGAHDIALISAGADNKEGTEDDLKSWE